MERLKMCGIVASWDRRGVDTVAVTRALDALRHRGPDGQGTWVSPDGCTALGHTRLAVIDPSGSPQPIRSEDGEIVLVVNGEFYDHERLRRDLQDRGHRFRTGGDSEIALHLYEDHGLGFVHHLRGEFALVLWDGRHRALIAARDRFGIKPLCYHLVPGERLLLASEAKALFALGVRPAWDHESLFQIAGMQYPRPEQTLFAGVKQLRPGQMLIARGKSVRIHPYWDMDYPRLATDPNMAAEADREALLMARLDEAVRLRLRADVPVCFHLSGGLDSTAVVALAGRYLNRPADCFTVGFEESTYDEMPLAQRTAAELGVRLHPVPIRQAELAEHLGDSIWYSEGLAINGHLPAKYLLARAIRRAGFKVVLSGEGSDEILGGYAHFRQDLLDATGGDSARLHHDNPVVAGMHLAEGEALSLDGVRQRLGSVPAFLHAKATLGRRMQSLLRDDFRARFADRDPLLHFVEAFDVEGQLSGRHPVDRASYLWTRSSLANYILRTLGDGTEMAHAVEGRLPFLDHELFALARTLPIDCKIHEGVEKWILRRALRGVVPEEVRARRKHPFTAPPASLFGGEFLQDTLRSRAVADVVFLDAGCVARVLDVLPGLGERERIAWDPVLMLVLSACLMQERFGL
jgi:asparagine synthase (glutamine-hydrolysing)